MSAKPKLGHYLWEQDRYMPVSPGRPTLYDADRGRAVVKALTEGLAISEAVTVAGVSLQTVYNWRRSHPDFNEAVALALRPGGRVRKIGTKSPRRDEFDNVIANLILDELARGRTMKDICKAEDMPSRQTVWRWAEDRPDFKARIEKCRKKNRKSSRR